MNLAKNPKPAELAALMTRCYDAGSSHILWVGFDGRVHLDPLPANLTPVGFQRRHEKEMKFRQETFQRGNDYVGPNAATDAAWVAKLFNELVYLWEKDFKGYSDVWQAPEEPMTTRI